MKPVFTGAAGSRGKSPWFMMVYMWGIMNGIHGIVIVIIYVVCNDYISIICSCNDYNDNNCNDYHSNEL